MTTYYRSEERRFFPKVTELYLQGFSTYDIKRILELNTNSKTLQRWLKESNIIRSKADAFRLAVKRGSVTYHKKPENEKKQRVTINSGLRYKIMSKYGFKCVLCGATAQTDRLQVDHINNNPSDNNEQNLQVLCETCNHGKYLDTL